MGGGNYFYKRSGIEKKTCFNPLIDGNDVIVAAVTSAQTRTLSDVALADWATSGLRVASTVRLSRLDCIENSLLIAQIGRLSGADAETIKEIWKRYVKPSF